MADPLRDSPLIFQTCLLFCCLRWLNLYLWKVTTLSYKPWKANFHSVVPLWWTTWICSNNEWWMGDRLCGLICRHFFLQLHLIASHIQSELWNVLIFTDSSPWWSHRCCLLFHFSSSSLWVEMYTVWLGHHRFESKINFSHIFLCKCSLIQNKQSYGSRGKQICVLKFSSNPFLHNDA